MVIAHQPLNEIQDRHRSHGCDECKQGTQAEDEVPLDWIAGWVLEPFDVFGKVGQGGQLKSGTAKRRPLICGTFTFVPPDVNTISRAGRREVRWPCPRLVGPHDWSQVGQLRRPRMRGLPHMCESRPTP